MATRYRAMAAPVDKSTGDGRRFAPGAIVSAEPPLPIRYVREDVGGHDGAMVVGRMDDITVEEGAIYGIITMFDDVDPQKMPTLSETVAEAMKLMDEGVLGLSVDLDDFDAEVVAKGTDTPITSEDMDPLIEEEIEDEDGPAEEEELELLITKGRIRAATLVDIPAFAETKGSFERLEDADAAMVATVERVAEDAALVASVAVDTRTAFDHFTPPVAINEPTPITYDFDRGVVYGHIFQHGVCHVGIPHECRTPPVDEDFRHFHVHPVETTEGTVFAGRITAGSGHAPRSLALSAVRAAHDELTTVAYVRASVDDHGIFVCGPLETGLDAEILGILSRRKVSGHWPEVGNEGDIFLAEVLALADGAPQDSEPGFPVGVHVRNGRVVGMTASLGPVAPVPQVTVEREGTPEHFQMTPEGLATLFRETYRLMEEEKASRELTTQARAGLLAAMDADAEMMRVDLARAIGE